jgi:hypothetical protein
MKLGDWKPLQIQKISFCFPRRILKTNRFKVCQLEGDLLFLLILASFKYFWWFFDTSTKVFTCESVCRADTQLLPLLPTDW